MKYKMQLKKIQKIRKSIIFVYLCPLGIILGVKGIILYVISVRVFYIIFNFLFLDRDNYLMLLLKFIIKISYILSYIFVLLINFF